MVFMISMNILNVIHFRKFVRVPASGIQKHTNRQTIILMITFITSIANLQGNKRHKLKSYSRMNWSFYNNIFANHTN